MPKTMLVWYRNDLRVHDHPALTAAAKAADQIVPVFVLDDAILKDRNASANRNRFLFECLEDLRASLQKLGSNLLIVHGKPEAVLPKLVTDLGAEAIYYSADYTPRAIERDKRVGDAVTVEFQAFPGRLIVDRFDALHTKNGKIHKVFTPFWKNWQQIERREIANVPESLVSPKINFGEMPSLNMLTKSDLSPNVSKGGETEARKACDAWLKNGIEDYAENHNDLAKDATSRLSPYLHFGCLSPREIETMLPQGEGAEAWHRQLAWREFYNYVLYNFPSNKTEEFQERYKNYRWDKNDKLLQAWKDGQTGYPIVDAAMRQLKEEGWMHNRARLIVGSFLTKDLGIDWREGEAHFMRWLLDGDTANNNGNWQWIASVGVDPAPVFRRLYNPASQQANYDPTGAYVKRYVKELKDVPNGKLAEPWDDYPDYPKPIVNHAEARQAALERYRSYT